VRRMRAGVGPVNPFNSDAASTTTKARCSRGSRLGADANLEADGQPGCTVDGTLHGRANYPEKEVLMAKKVKRKATKSAGLKRLPRRVTLR
jgi:hypothetical protein